MKYELTSDEKSLVIWMVEAYDRGELEQSFRVQWFNGGVGVMIDGYHSAPDTTPDFESHMLDDLEEEGLLRSQKSTKITTREHGTKKNPKTTNRETETSRRCTLLVGKARQAVENDFVKEELQSQQPPVINQTNNFNASVNYAAIGPHSHVEVTQTLDLDAVRERIDREGGEYRRDLHELLDFVESASKDGTVVERGALSKFDEAMQNRSWIVSPVISLLLSFLSVQSGA